ncbi:Holliday junction recognition protein [Grammomys surdaster]|uniref:Holliday junction recognition protein n=1 Tax=Grammomys surdaster TaxID=491861 RepID=UPI0010A07EFF|nr:Holliday junction recognition protein [Grammomys surdaster]
MESMDPQYLRLHQHLKESRSRFQTLMQRLIAKYNQPFEDDPLVQMATLTYQTPYGLRIWGGKLIKKGDEEQMQGPFVKMIDRLNGQAPEGDSESSSVNASLEGEEDWPSCSLTKREVSGDTEQHQPTVPGNTLKTDLRRKYLTQVDILLQDAEYFKNAEKGGGQTTVMTWVPPVTSAVTPAPGCQDSMSAKSFGGPELSASSSRDQDPCPADMTIVTRNDSSLVGTSSNSISSQSLEVDGVCNVTISELYDGMMHSMSRLLRSQPACIISTKTHINRNWQPRKRLSHKHRAHKNTTYHYRSKPSWRVSRKGHAPCSEPEKEARILRDYKNLPHVAPHKTGVELKSISLEGSKLRKELQVMPQKYLDSEYHLERENRVKALQWLISPVKMVPRPRMLPSQVEKWYREIKIKFDKLHQECCLSPGKRPRLTGPTESWAADIFRDGSKSPDSHQGVETLRLSSPFSREKTERPGKALEDLRGRSVKTNSCLLRIGPFPEDSLSQSPGHSQQRSGLRQEHNSEPIGKAVWPSTASSAPCIGSPGCGKSHYDELKKEFSRLYQKYCLVSPQRVKVASCGRVSPVKAATAVPGETEHLKRLNPDSPFQSFQKRSTSPSWRIRIPEDSTAVEAHVSAQTASAFVRDSRLSTKRRKLSYPVVCAHQAKSQDSSGAAGWPECPDC